MDSKSKVSDTFVQSERGIKDFDLLIESLAIEIDRYGNLKNSINNFTNRIKPRRTEQVGVSFVDSIAEPSILDRLTNQVEFFKCLNDELFEISEHMDSIG